MARIILTLFLFLVPLQVTSDERNYGSLIYNSDIPDTLFMMGNIEKKDTFSLRKALRNHEITTLVLASPGGLIWEGLSMAGIVFDKGLKVYIPENATCASACAFMFFAGQERKALGKLGVHQFYSSSSNATANLNQTEAGVQFTVSEIIGFLNEFDTPRFVLERMFQQQDMYWFTQKELNELMTVSFSVPKTTQNIINSYWKKTQTKKSEIKYFATKYEIKCSGKRPGLTAYPGKIHASEYNPSTKGGAFDWEWPKIKERGRNRFLVVSIDSFRIDFKDKKRLATAKTNYNGLVTSFSFKTNYKYCKEYTATAK